jgi:hypothetical protein
VGVAETHSAGANDRRDPVAGHARLRPPHGALFVFTESSFNYIRFFRVPVLRYIAFPVEATIAYPFAPLLSFFSEAGLPIAAWAAIAGGAIVGSLASIVLLLTRLPPTYFRPSHDRRFMPGRHWVIRGCAVAAKNAIGVLLVLIGVPMALPGVPGPGLLVLLIGTILLDFPGKRALEYRIVSRPVVLGAINRLRRAFARPPLVLA